MSNILYGFILTTIAGLSTLLGAIIIFFIKKKSDNIIIGALSFASGVMITISLIDLIPESINLLSTKFVLFPTMVISSIFVVVGILFSILIEKYLPDNTSKNSSLYRVGIISMLAIILHNIPEGIATFMTTTTDIKLGVSLCVAIACHNIPEGISIATPIYYSTNKKRKALLYTFISGLSEPFGALIAYFFLSKYVNNAIMGILLAIIAGIMLHISFYELLPTAKKYHNYRIFYLFLIIGCIFMIINHLLFN
jgi:ZIP family zinc transporter